MEDDDYGANAPGEDVAGEEFTDDDIISVMISTDNHVGFMDKDPIRRDDSFLAFEEVLVTAKEKRVDLVFLAGDLYHENSPSRATEFRTMEILRKHVLGYEPVGVQVISDQSQALTNSHVFNRVNWEDPHYNVALPVFAIHGNHDDPVREGNHVLAPLDVLSVANLVNYVGKADNLQTIVLTPLLLRKGKTKVALYGLGNIRDDRFSRLLVNNQVTFRRPATDPNSYFSVLLMHQNRDNRTMRNRGAIPHFESFLPRFLDLVIWGHEHECRIDVVQTLHQVDKSASASSGEDDSGRSTFIMQPGSTVATSLTEGEAAPKHAFKLDIRGGAFRTTPIPLRCVRPFVLDEVSLASDSGVNPDAPDAEQQVAAFLRKRVDALLSRADRQIAALPSENCPPASMRLPLVRLKVEHSGFHTLPNTRFGSGFVSSVANPSDILLFWRRPKARVTLQQKGKGAASSDASGSSPLGPVVPQELSNVSLGDLINDTLASMDLQMLPKTELQHAIGQFLEGTSGAIRASVESLISSAISNSLERNEITSTEDVKKYVKGLRERADADDDLTLDDSGLEGAGASTQSSAAASSSSSKRAQASSSSSTAPSLSRADRMFGAPLAREDGRGGEGEDNEDGRYHEYAGEDGGARGDDDDDLMDQAGPSAKSSSSSSSRGGGRGRGRGASSSKAASSRSRAAATKSPGASKGRATKGAGGKGTRRRGGDSDGDEEEEEESDAGAGAADDDDDDDDTGHGASRLLRRGGDDYFDNEEDYEPSASASASSTKPGRGKAAPATSRPSSSKRATGTDKKRSRASRGLEDDYAALPDDEQEQLDAGEHRTSARGGTRATGEGRGGGNVIDLSEAPDDDDDGSSHAPGLGARGRPAAISAASAPAPGARPPTTSVSRTLPFAGNAAAKKR